ncbi:hypothetical protein SLNWT_6047 [Streptomyces albus]|uniref:Uncharacterized protein n=1 Tax=Streptomyces albus (strain ATCC 21838 / DSM 41398 / FERM P-419 / JCM 4703 / NBRC 107858) TaxID=1081613 RepID=A0A0B5EUA7_STRA4|nr:hypothetical protein SLNWT_6047 [Streptomyces albus]AOU80726.1 hypothetical protein SLNHY_6035 [Streptomyces albus]AYN36433.1 hypothetical protein DUI70_5940 [Streptomyces albus]
MTRRPGGAWTLLPAAVRGSCPRGCAGGELTPFGGELTPFGGWSHGR